MLQAVTVRPAHVGDAGTVADFAEGRRRVYHAYSPVSWRPAPDARLHHAPFLQACVADGHHSAFVAESAEVVVGAAIANHRVRVPPFAHDREAS